MEHLSVLSYDIQHNDNQHNDIQDKGVVYDTQHNWPLSITMLCIMLSVVKMNVAFYLLLCCIIMLNVVMLSAVILNVVVLNVVAPSVALILGRLLTLSANIRRGWKCLLRTNTLVA